MASRHVTFAAFALTLLACAMPPPVSPSAGGALWYELVGDHFVLRTDLGQADARAAAEQLEHAYVELVAGEFPNLAARPPPVHVVMFRDEGEMHAYWSTLNGFAVPKLPGDVERESTIVLHAQRYALLDEITRRTFLHELTHRFLASTYGPLPLPVWLNEGMASYFSTMHAEDGKATFGDPPFQVVSALFFPSVAQILTASPDTFYAGQRNDERAQVTRQLFYSGAWALVHFLLAGPDDERARFRALLARLKAGEAFADAWAATVGAVPLDQLQEEFRSYLTGSAWDRIRASCPEPTPGRVGTPRRMSDLETDVLWVRLLGGSPKTELARAALKDAARVAPGSPEVDYWQGCLAMAEHRPQEARGVFTAALARAPDDPRLLFGLVASVAGDAKGAGGAEVADAMQRLSRSARTPDELALVAEYLRRRGLGKEADEAERRVSALDSAYFASQLPGGSGQPLAAALAPAGGAEERAREERQAAAPASWRLACRPRPRPGETTGQAASRGRGPAPTGPSASKGPPAASPEGPPAASSPKGPPAASPKGPPAPAPTPYPTIADALDHEGELVEHWRQRIEGYPGRTRALVAAGQGALGARAQPTRTYLGHLHDPIHAVFQQTAMPAWNAARQCMSGSARLEVVLNAEGGVEDLGVIQPSGYPLFDAMALEAVARAAPFGAPPELVRSKDDRVYLQWTFLNDGPDGCAASHAVELYLP